MEKMQLGSPAGSPAAGQYLPNFLLMGIQETPTNLSFCKCKLLFSFKLTPFN